MSASGPATRYSLVLGRPRARFSFASARTLAYSRVRLLMTRAQPSDLRGRRSRPEKPKMIPRGWIGFVRARCNTSSCRHTDHIVMAVGSARAQTGRGHRRSWEATVAVERARYARHIHNRARLQRRREAICSPGKLKAMLEPRAIARIERERRHARRCAAVMCRSIGIV
jgi:hypothetical protein